MSVSKTADTSILHHINLDLYGGLQTHFLRFVKAAAMTHGVHNSAWLESPQVHAEAGRSQGVSALRVMGSPKTLGRLKLPGWPPAIRRSRLEWIFKKSGADLGLIWDGFNRSRVAHQFRDHGLHTVYWEHGASWYSHHRAEKTSNFWNAIDTVLCNSNAARRMLELRWDCPLPVHVCLNGVASDSRERPALTRSAPVARRFRLGTAGHLRTYKGAHVAIKALAALRGRGMDVELWLAGVGPKQAELEYFAERLAVADFTKFCGFVSNMQHDFFDHIDIFVHPAMREAFGLVCAEAMLSGCPVVATRVDGLPEVVTHGKTGLCVSPDQPAAALTSLGTTLEDRVNCVYDPETDQVATPRFCDPDKIADAVESILRKEASLETFSANAIEDANTRLSFERHLEDAFHALNIAQS